MSGGGAPWRNQKVKTRSKVEREYSDREVNTENEVQSKKRQGASTQEGGFRWPGRWMFG